MTDHSTDKAPGGLAADPLIRAMGGLGDTLARYTRWPSRRRRDALITALNTVLVLHLDAVARSMSYELARLEVQQGRHERRIAALEGKDGSAREVGG